MTNGILFFKAFSFGLTIAATLGPIATLCVRETLLKGVRSGLAIGMGAATADGLYAAVAAYGISSITSFLVNSNQYLHVAGGILLCYIGIRIFRSRESIAETSSSTSRSYLSNYFKTILITLANPLTILLFLGIACALENHETPYAAFTITMGVFLGSVLWHLFLVSSFRLAKDFLKPMYFKIINDISALILFSFGMYMLFQ